VLALTLLVGHAAPVGAQVDAELRANLGSGVN
jgi:hypothetical protein